MKTARSLAFTLCIVLAIASLAGAQAIPSITNSSPGGDASFGSGIFLANAYNYTGAAVYTGNASTGSASMTVRGGYVVLPDSRNVLPFAVGVPIVVSDATPELVTPTAVSGCYRSQGMNQDGILVTCTITASFANTHGAGAQILSATNGLAEAALDAFNWGGGVVIIAPGWSLGLNTSCTNCFASKSAAIAALLPFSDVVIKDYTVLGLGSEGVQYFAARPTGTTPLASGVAPTVSAATGGSMASGSHRVKYVYVDINGQYGQPSLETADVASRTGLSVAGPAASTGAVGWIPYVSAASGATKTETQVPVTSLVCTLSKLTPIPACAVTNATYGQTGSNATILADPSGTPKIFGNTSLTFANDTGYTGSSTTAAYVPVPPNSAFFPFSPVILGAATAAASNSTYEVASWNLPANFFNVLGENSRLCINGHATSAANSQTLTVNFRFGPYQNSDTVLNALVTTAYSTTSVVDIKACVELTTTVLGATGTIVTDHGLLTTNLAGSATLTQFTEATASNANTGVIGSLPLTTNQQLTIENVIGAGAFGSAITWDKIALERTN